MQRIEEAAERGELTELVLMVIWNRLDLARRDVSWCSIIGKSWYYLYHVLVYCSLPDPSAIFLFSLRQIY